MDPEIADSGNEGAADQVAEAAIEIADDASARADAAEAITDEVIAAAEERVEAAEETAEQIAAAAIEGERGRRIETIEGEIAQCRTMILEQQSLLQNLQEGVAALAGAVDGMLAMNQSSSIRQAPMETVKEAPPIAEPETANAPAEAAQEAPAMRRRRRVRWI